MTSISNSLLIAPNLKGPTPTTTGRARENSPNIQYRPERRPNKGSTAQRRKLTSSATKTTPSLQGPCSSKVSWDATCYPRTRNPKRKSASWTTQVKKRPTASPTTRLKVYAQPASTKLSSRLCSLEPMFRVLQTSREPTKSNEFTRRMSFWAGLRERRAKSRKELGGRSRKPRTLLLCLTVLSPARRPPPEAHSSDSLRSTQIVIRSFLPSAPSLYLCARSLYLCARSFTLSCCAPLVLLCCSSE